MATFFTDADLSGAGEFVEPEVWLATEFTVPAGTALFRWRWPAIAPVVTPQIRVYDSVGTLVAGPLSFDTTNLSSWNYVGGGTPTALSAGTYRVVINTTRYPAKAGFFTSGSITRGNITAVQSRFGSPGSPPSSTSTATYFVDMDFTATGVGPTPDSLAVPVALGAPSVNAGITAAPGSLAVPVALGAPSVNAGITAAPGSLAVPVALGAPSAGLAQSAPNGLTIPVALGAPTIGVPGVAPNGLAVPVALGAPSIVFSVTPNSLAVPVALGAPSVGVTSGSGGWRDFGGIIQGAINDAAVNAEKRRNPIECPEHGWPLEITSRGRHCQFGGHVVIGR